MSGTLSGLGISLSGINASQSGLNVTGQNIANANTKGYTSKLTNFTSNDYGIANGSIGTTSTYGGVSVQGVYRARDTFLDTQFRTQNSHLKYNSVVSDSLIKMNNILGEPSDSGLTAKLNAIYQAASDLSANPELETAKQVFADAASALTDTFRQTDSSISNLRNSLDDLPHGKISTDIISLNNKLIVLADVHQQVLSQKALGHETTTLEDQRDLLLDEISGILDVTIVKDSNGDFVKLTMAANVSEAKVTSTNTFTNHDSPLAFATGSTNNVLTLSVNNGNGIATGPFSVTFDDGSSIRDVVEKINQSFNAAGGQGSIASIDRNNKLVLQTDLIEDSRDTSTAAVNVVSGTSLTILGLTAGVTSGSDAESYTIVDNAGLHYKFNMSQGYNEVGSNPVKLQLTDTSTSQNVIGTVHNFSGSLGGLFQAVNSDIPDMRKQLDDLAMNLKDNINNLLTLGVTGTGSAGSALFTGNKASDFDVSDTVMGNLSLLAQGKAGASGDGTIAAEIARLFNSTETIVSDGSTSEKLYIDSPDSAAVRSSVPIIPGQAITIRVNGVITDGASEVNAGTNGLGGGSLVQFRFLNAAGAVVGAVNNFAASSGPPSSEVSYTGTIPAGAAFVEFIMNGTTFNDNDLTDNLGHFGVSVYQGTNNTDIKNFNNSLANVVGDYGTRANLANQKLSSSEALYGAVDNSRQSVSGVSIEEEASNLIKFQNAYSANAKVMTVFDEVIQELLNMIR